MNTQMATDEYVQALKAGQKEYKELSAAGKPTHPAVLDELLPENAAETVETLAEDLLRGRVTEADTVRDEMLHTVACKAAIKAGWVNDEKELLAVAKAVMSDESLKYCPHGRPICVSLSKKNLERQFKRT